jgi:hypothetical protein
MKALSVFWWAIPPLPGLSHSISITNTLGGGVTFAVSCALADGNPQTPPIKKHNPAHIPIVLLNI